MKNQFKPGDLIGNAPNGYHPDEPLPPQLMASGDFRGIILDINSIGNGGFRQWCITLLITLNLNYNEYFQKEYPVNTVKTLTINDLSKWRKIINV